MKDSKGTYSIDFTEKAISDFLKKIIKKSGLVKLAPGRSVEVIKNEEGFLLNIRVYSLSKKPLIELGEKVQDLIFEELKIAANINPKRINVHFEKILGG